MTAHILIVEDDENYIAELQAILAGIGAPHHVAIATNRNEARALLDDRFFDFAILDLKIPTGEGTLDLDPEHGKYIFHHARKVTPGTKLLVLTSSPSEDFIADMLTQKHDADIWGEGAKVDTVEFLRKIEIDRAPDKISKVVAAVQALDGVELQLQQVNLETGEDRLIRIFAKGFEARRCVVSKIGAGKSGAKTLRVHLHDASGAVICEAVAKLGSLEKMQDEGDRYEKNIILLNPAVTPRKMAMLEFGAGPTAGLFYQLASGHEDSMFETMAANDAQAAKCVGAAAAALADWSNGKPETSLLVADIRRSWVSDEKALELQNAFGLDWAKDFENRDVQTRWCCVHGDFHGENVLVADSGQVMVIDYGNVGLGAASYDPVSLELSAVLQNNPTISPDWPSEENCRAWHEIEDYLAGCPMPEFIRTCREWAEKVAAGRREIAACAYTYLLRQLKYDDTNKARILALLDGAQAMMAAT